jgi:hypothetical protein
MKRARIDALLGFADGFAAPDFVPGTFVRAPDRTLSIKYDEAVNDFLDSLHKYGWISSRFDWPKWQETAREYVELPEKLQSADLQTIQKLLTTHVRKDRFCEGHLYSMFANGHIVAVLRRLQVLQATLPPTARERRGAA